MTDLSRPGENDEPEPDEDRVTLRVRDKAFSGWTSVEITTSLEEVCSAGAVAVAGVYAYSAGFIREDEDIMLWVGDEVLITGVVDDLDLGGDAETNTAQVALRSKLRDVIDCAAPIVSKSGLTLVKLLETLLSRYPIAVVDECGVGSTIIRSFRTEPGETLFDAFDRLTRDLEFLITDDAAGRLVLTQAGKAGRVVGARIERGAVGFLSGNARRSCAARFSEVVCQGQSINDSDVEVAAQGAAIDVGVRRFRQLIIKPERGTSKAAALKRARWEVATRAGKALEYTCKLRGWRDGNGNLWRKNTLVEVLDAHAGVWSAELLVVDVTYRLSAKEGRTTDLRLLPPEAFLVEPGKPVDVSTYAYEAPPSTAPDDDFGDEWSEQ